MKHSNIITPGKRNSKALNQKDKLLSGVSHEGSYCNQRQDNTNLSL